MPSGSDPWLWKMRLFASVDLVGSTAYKARDLGGVPQWVPTFTSFFEDFPNAVEEEYSRLLPTPRGAEALPTSRLKPWKFLGDEILFYVDIQQHYEVAAHVLAFKRAIKSFPTGWREKKIPLSLKGAAWIAGFPVINREVHIPDPKSESRILDFIGPSIDLGFRISKFSEERRLVVSVDLALMLLDGVDWLEWNKKEFYLVMAKREHLKGVIGGEPYPVIYIHMANGEHDREERVLGISLLSNWTELKDYLREFIDEREPRMARPFIASDRDTKYNAIPPNFEENRRALQATDTANGYAEQATQPEPPPEGVPSEPKMPILPGDPPCPA